MFAIVSERVMISIFFKCLYYKKKKRIILSSWKMYINIGPFNLQNDNLIITYATALINKKLYDVITVSIIHFNLIKKKARECLGGVVGKYCLRNLP